MSNQECLDRAMFAAHESYSHTAYIPEDYGCAEGSEYEENLMAAKGKEPIGFLQAA